MLNYNEEISKEELEILNSLKNKNYIIILNKVDLSKKINIDLDNTVKMSTIKNIGFDDLKNRIVEMYEIDKINVNKFNYVSSARSISLIEKSLSNITKSLELNCTAVYGQGISTGRKPMPSQETG